MNDLSESESTSQKSLKTAEDFFKAGYNCAQSVLAAHCAEVGLDLETALKIAAPFGAGVGRMRNVCGAFSGCAMLIGLRESTGESTPKEKERIYRLTQEAARKFAEINGGSIICAELLNLAKKEKTSPTPDARNTEYYAKRPCLEIVKSASQIFYKS